MSDKTSERKRAKMVKQDRMNAIAHTQVEAFQRKLDVHLACTKHFKQSWYTYTATFRKKYLTQEDVSADYMNENIVYQLQSVKSICKAYWVIEFAPNGMIHAHGLLCSRPRMQFAKFRRKAQVLNSWSQEVGDLNQWIRYMLKDKPSKICHWARRAKTTEILIDEWLPSE